MHYFKKMFKKLLLLATFLLTFIHLNAQNSTIFKSKYIDIYTKNNFVYALSKTNKLVVWDLKNGDISYIKKEVSCIYSNNNQLYHVNLDGEIQKEIKRNQWKKIGAVTGTPYAIVTTSSNKIAAISSRGIKFNHKYYMPTEKNRIGNGMYSFKNRKLRKPQLTYIDNEDRIWVSYIFGEFFEIFIFDTKNTIFINHKSLSVLHEKKTYNTKTDFLKDYQRKQFKKYPYYVKKIGKEYIYRFPTQLPLYYGIKSITQDNLGNYFFSEGLLSSHIKNGIFQYQTTTKNKFYKATEHIETSFQYQNEIIGPVKYNKYNNKLYYYSNYGFFKLLESESQLKKELIVDPNALLYSKKNPPNYGRIMTIKKIEFIDEKQFIFLTTQYGFGYYDGENITLFN